MTHQQMFFPTSFNENDVVRDSSQEYLSFSSRKWYKGLYIVRINSRTLTSKDHHNVNTVRSRRRLHGTLVFPSHYKLGELRNVRPPAHLLLGYLSQSGSCNPQLAAPATASVGRLRIPYHETRANASAVYSVSHRFVQPSVLSH